MTYEIYAPHPADFDAAYVKSIFAADRRVGLDTEFTGGGIWHPDAQLRLVQFATPSRAAVLDMREPVQIAVAADMLADAQRLWVAHNASGAEVPAVWRGLGVDISPRIYDTLINALLVYPGELDSHGLKDFAHLLGDAGRDLLTAEAELHDEFRSLWRAAGHAHGKIDDILTYGFTHVSSRSERYLRYAALDAICVARLAPIVAQMCREVGVYGCIPAEQRINQVASRMHLRGWQTNSQAVDGALLTVGGANAAAHARFEARYGVLARSPKRIEVVRGEGVDFRVFNPVTKRGVVNPKLSKEVLRELHEEYPDSYAVTTLLEVAETANLTGFLTTLREFVDRNNCVHPSIRTLGAVSGRWRVVRPAIQTASTKSGARRVFVSRYGADGVLLSADLGQIEPRVAFALSEQQELIDLCRQGIDPYAAAAIRVFGEGYTPRQRKVAKRIVLGTLFASGVATLTRQAKYTDGILDIDERQIAAARTAFRNSVPKVTRLAKWLEQQPDIRLPSGRFAPHDPDRMYRAINSFVQGSARDFLMKIMLDIEDAGLGQYMILTMHDEILLDVPCEALVDVVDTVRVIMCQGYRGVPTTTDIEVFDKHWDGAGVPWNDYQLGVRQ